MSRLETVFPYPFTIVRDECIRVAFVDLDHENDENGSAIHGTRYCPRLDGIHGLRPNRHILIRMSLENCRNCIVLVLVSLEIEEQGKV
jgi:hypothetical protein